MSEEVEVQTEVAEISTPELVETAPPVIEEKPVKTFTQEELDSIVAKRLAKESRKLTRQAELEVENRLLREQATKREVKAEPSAPSQSEYASYEEYLEAKAEYIAEQKVNAKLAEREKKEAQSSAEAERNKAIKIWEQKVEAATNKYADYGEALEAVDHVEIPVDLQRAIMESDLGADLAYHLAKNSDELERIVKLKPHAALMALGKLEDKLSQAPEPKKVPVSKAPEPIKPLGGKSEVSTEHHPNDSFETFVRKRNAEKRRY
jgi:hypothetical protein